MSGRDEIVAKRNEALRRTRAVGEAEGLSKRLLDESDASMRQAFMMGDMLDVIYGRAK